MTPLHDLSAIELLDAYRSKALSPVEVTRSVLAHMHKWEPHLHATWALEGDEALAQAAGTYVTYLDDDDIYYPCHVETLAWHGSAG